MDSSTINLTFTYSENDFVRAMRAHYALHLRLWLDLPAIVVTAIAGIYLWYSPSLHWLSILCIVSSAILALILVLAFLIIPRFVFRRESKFRDEYLLQFSSEGGCFKTVHIDSQLQWSIYSKALVDAFSYVLYYGKGSFTVIPKRAFHDSDQRTAFEQLLSQHVPKIIRKD